MKSDNTLTALLEFIPAVFLKAVYCPPPDLGLGFWLTDMMDAGF